MPEEAVQFSPPLDIPAAYFNGFELGLSNSDVSIIMLANGKPQSMAHVSFTTAKSLHIAMGQLIDVLESATDRKIMTMDEIASGLTKTVSSTTSPKEDTHG